MCIKNIHYLLWCIPPDAVNAHNKKVKIVGNTAVMCNIIHTKPNLLILVASYDYQIWNCSIIPIADFLAIADVSSSDLKSLTCAYYYKKNTSVLSFKISPRFWSCFRNELLRSLTYRRCVWKNFYNHVNSAARTVFVEISLTDEPKCSIDFKL